MLIRRSGTQVIGERQTVSLPGAVDLARAPHFELGSLKGEPPTLQVYFDGASHTIEPRVMQVLVLLASERGSVVSRDRLINCCWSGRVVGEDAINRSIAKVRRIGDESRAFEIDTIPRVGYRLVAAGERALASGAHASASRPLFIVLTAILIVGLAAGGLWYLRSTNEQEQATIAVLPFEALNSDADTRNFGESMAATVRTALVQTGARLPDGDLRTLEDARRSGAAIVVSGTIRRDGSLYRVTARVDSARAGAMILSNQFDAPGADAPALGARVAAWLTPPVRMWASFLPVEREPETTDEIMRIFLTRASGDLLRAWKLSRSLAAAKPGSGAAQLVFALLTSDVLDLIAPDQRRASVDSARRAALAAAHLLPDPARPLAVLQCHLTAPGWHVLTPKCDAANRAAIAANPDVPLLPFLFGWELADSGRFAEAAKFADMDLAQSPLGSGQLTLRIFVTQMSHAGDVDDVLPQLKDRMRRYVGPGSTGYTDFEIAIANGNIAASYALLNGSDRGSVKRHGHPWDAMSPIASGEARTVTQLVLSAVKSRNPADVARMRESCNPSGSGTIPPDPAFGACLVGLTMVGDRDGVFALATRGYRDLGCCSAGQEEQWLASGGDYYPRWELFGKAMASVRADARFIEIARRTGLLAYWKSGYPPDFCAFERVPVCALLQK